MVLTWMGPLMYLCDGHIVYEYSFLVDLNILSPLMQLIFSFGKLQDRHGSLGLFAADLPWEDENKIVCRAMRSPRAPEGILGCSQSIVPYYHGARSISVVIWLLFLVPCEILVFLCSQGNILIIKNGY